MDSLNNNVLNEMAFGLTKYILPLADNSKEALPKLVDKLREITGAKIVAMFQYPEDIHGEKEKHTLVGSSPKRKKVIAESEIIWGLVKTLHSRKKITLISDGSNKKEYKKLSKRGFENSLIVPLILNKDLFANYLLLGLPANANLNIIIKGLYQLTDTVKVLFRYSIVNSRMEELVKARTKDLIESNKKLQLEITERKQAKELLYQYEKIASSSNDMMALMDRNFKYIAANAAYLKAFGKTYEELIGHTIEEIFGKDFFKSKIKPRALRCLSGEVTNYQEWINFPIKGKCYMDIMYFPYKNKQNKINGFVVIGRDITERKKIKEKLIESEQWNREIFEGSRDAIFIIDTNTHIVDVNKAAENLTGYSKSQLLQMSIRNLYEDKDLEAYNNYFQRIIGGESIISEAKILKKDGTKIEAEFSNKQVILNNVPYIHTIARDITKRKLNEKLIRQKNNQLLLLSKAATKLNKILNIEVILQKLTKIAVELTGSTSGTAALYEDKKIVFKKYYDNGKITDIDFKFKKGYGVPGWIIKTKKPYMTNDAKNDKHVIKEIREKLNFHQLIDTPILNKQGDLLGCFEIHNTIDNRPYNENDIEILHGLAVNTSVAIENAQMLLEREKVKEELTESESKYRRLFENNLSGVYVSTISGKILDCNEAFVSILGYSSKEEVLKTNATNFHQNKKEREIFIQKLKRKKGLSNLESKAKKKDGSFIYIIENVQLVKENILQGTVVDITQRKQDENKIKESRQRLTSHLDNTPLAGIFWDIDLKVTDWNTSAEKIFGYSKEEALGRYAYELIVPKEIQGEIDDVFDNLLTQTGGYRSTNENMTKEGKRILCDWYNVAVTDINGKVTGVASLANDITDRIKTEAALKATSEFNGSLIETIPFGLDIVDLEGNILFMNNLLKDAVGVENPKGKCWELYKDDGEQCTDCPLKNKLELGEINISEIHNALGGREYEVTHNVMNYNGKRAVLEIFRDITESKKAQNEILKLLRGLEQSPAMIVITDIDGKIEFINPKVTEVTGFSEKELIGKNTRIFQSGKTLKKTYKELWDTILNGEIWEGEILNKRKNGVEYWEFVRISPILNDKGKIINFIGIKEEITEKIEARNELTVAKNKAEEMSRIKSNFLANMSHELRTPLVGILGFTEILEESINNLELKEYAVMINESGQRLLETLNLILNLSKIESDNINVELSNVDAIKNIQNIIESFKVIAAKKNIDIKLMSNIKKFEIEIDKRMLDQIINNLLNNAVKFTKKGGITIIVNKVKSNTFLEIQVTDTGIGISKEKQKIIWKEFRQVSEGTSRMFEGAGLGLTVTEEFVHKLGGDIQLKSKLGEGSTFTVLLPINKNKKNGMTIKQSAPIKVRNTKKIVKDNILNPVLY